MYKVYFKQAVQMLLQNRFISIISILGTALAIMMIMTIVVTDEIKTISIAPEINRDRILYINYQAEFDTTGQSFRSGSLNYNVIDEYLLKMESVELISSISGYDHYHLMNVNREGSDEILNLIVRLTDDAYWKIMSFTFVEGRPFSKEESESGIPLAVLSETTARKLFKGEDAMGQIIQVHFRNYRVIGIVKDVSPVFKEAYSGIWLVGNVSGKDRGGYTALLLAHDKKDFPLIIEEVRKIEKKMGANNPPWKYYLKGPENQRIYTMDLGGNSMEDVERGIKINNRKMIFVLLVLLLIPAINLSGFSLSRIKRRTAEIGIRKAFGAKKYIILIQVLYENLITSLIGGFIGLIFSYLIVFRMRHWLLEVPADSAIPGSMMVSLSVFLAVFLVCILLNLLSAGIPAYRASRMSIINSLNQNDK